MGCVWVKSIVEWPTEKVNILLRWANNQYFNPAIYLEQIQIQALSEGFLFLKQDELCAKGRSWPFSEILHEYYLPVKMSLFKKKVFWRWTSNSANSSTTKTQTTAATTVDHYLVTNHGQKGLK